MKATPEMIAAAWATWKSRHGGKLGPGPAFVEAIEAALAAAPASAAEPVTRQTIPPSLYADIVAPYAAALGMVRDAIGELFGPVASIESEEAVLLRGPEPHHDAEAIIAALQRIRLAIDT